MFALKTILHPTDFSEHADHAFRMACSMARDYGAKLVILHVAAPPVYIYGEGIVPPEPEVALDAVREHLMTIRPDDPSLAVEHVLVEGDTVPEILRIAEDVHANLIVIGTHGRGRLARLLLGSVAEQIVRRAPCPVVTVKKPAAEPAREQEMVAAGEVFGVWP